MILRAVLSRVPPGLKSWILDRPKLRAAMRSALNVLVPSGPRLVAIADGPARGLLIMADLNREKAHWLGTYEPEIADLLEQLVRPGMTVYDIGGHIGYFSLVLSRIVGPTGKVLVFEPDPGNAQRIKRMIAANKLQNRITLVQSAVADHTGTAGFTTDSSDTSTGKLGAAQAAGDAPLVVQTVTLDEFTRRHPAPDFIKMDVEGAEGRALGGMTRVLKENRPRMLVEIHGAEVGSAVWRHLSDNGYIIEHVEEKRPVGGPQDVAGGHILASPV